VSYSYSYALNRAKSFGTCPAPRYPGAFGCIAFQYGTTNTCNQPSQNAPASAILSTQSVSYNGDCVQACLSTSGCQSFSSRLQHYPNTCTLYSAPVESYLSPITDWSAWDGQYYTDVGCYMYTDKPTALGCNMLSPSPPADASCGESTIGANAAQKAHYGQTDGYSLSNCAPKCMVDTNCQSFSFDPWSGTCHLFSESVALISQENPDDGTMGRSISLYDVECFIASDIQQDNCQQQR